MIPVRVAGTGSCVPDNIVTNKDIAERIETSDEWIRSRTGICERRLANGQSTSDLASLAAGRALDDAGLSPEQVDLVIVGTLSPDRFTPTVSCTVQKDLNLTNATCIDLWAGCTGFVFSLMTAHSLMETRQLKSALVIGAECLSKLTNWQDRNTCVLFGDGAGAVVLRAGEANGLLNHVSWSDGSRGEVLISEGVPRRNLIHDSDEVDHSIRMVGTEVFKFAVKAMADSITGVLSGTDYSLSDIDYIVPHQANNRIVEYVSDHMNVPREKFYTNLDRYGNTSAASIPIALDEMNSKGLLSEGMMIITVGFGGGLTWGANLINWTSSRQ